MSEQPRPRVRLPAVVRPRALAVFVVVVLLVGSAGVAIGASMPSTADVDEAAMQAPPQVDAAVERRSIDPPRMLQGLVDAGDTRKVAFGGVSGGVLPYVTEVGTAAGSPLSNGRLLIAVADQPRIALHVEAPLYRDLQVGDEGRDVQAFESALKAVVPGDFDVDEDFTANTLAAAEKLWDGLGYDLPTRVVDAVAPSSPGVTTTATTASSAPVPAASAPAAPVPVASPSTAPAPSAAAATQAYIDVTQIVQLPADSVGVLSVLAVGATAAADAPLATLQTSPRRVVARASVVDAEEFAVGVSVTLRVSGRSDQSGVVVRQGEFVASDGSAQSVAGRDVFVDLPGDWADLAEKSTVMLTTVEAGEPVLAVPLAAVHDASTAPFVVASGGDRSDPGEHVPIEVLGAGDGWVRIGEESGLVEGDRVVVSP